MTQAAWPRQVRLQTQEVTALSAVVREWFHRLWFSVNLVFLWRFGAVEIVGSAREGPSPAALEEEP